MSFEENVKHVLEACPGARAVAIVDPDGIPVIVEPQRADTEVLGAEMASLIRTLFPQKAAHSKTAIVVSSNLGQAFAVEVSDHPHRCDVPVDGR